MSARITIGSTEIEPTHESIADFTASNETIHIDADVPDFDELPPWFYIALAIVIVITIKVAS